MKRSQAREISPAEFVGTLNRGGWIIGGGEEMKNSQMAHGSKVVRAAVCPNDGSLTIVTEKGDIHLSDNRILEPDKSRPWRMDFYATCVMRQQRKKADGGGWHEVLVPRIALSFYNPTMEQATYKRWEEEAKRAEDERKRRVNEEREAIRKLLMEQLDGCVGKTVAKITADGSSLVVKFTDGSTVNVYVEWDYGSTDVRVNGASLHNFYDAR